VCQFTVHLGGNEPMIVINVVLEGHISLNHPSLCFGLFQKLTNHRDNEGNDHNQQQQGDALRKDVHTLAPQPPHRPRSYQ
jgi:hypothetical protein